MDLISQYEALILAIVDFTGASHRELHVHAGLLIYCLSQLFLGTTRGSKRALAVTLFVELFNETMNRLYFGSWRPDDTLMDILATMAWPTALFGVSFIRRRLYDIRVERYRTIRALMAVNRSRVHQPNFSPL